MSLLHPKILGYPPWGDRLETSWLSIRRWGGLVAVHLSLARYEQGLADYFEVLEAQQDLYPALMDLAQTRFNELRSVIELYGALGGGWELGVDWERTPAEAAAPPSSPEAGDPEA